MGETRSDFSAILEELNQTFDETICDTLSLDLTADVSESVFGQDDDSLAATINSPWIGAVPQIAEPILPQLESEPEEGLSVDQEISGGENTHVNEAAQSVEDARFKCAQCDKSYSRKSSLQFHKRKHIGDPPFKCAKCPKCFDNQWRLDAHSLIHTADRPFQCPDCPKAYIKENRLALHRRSHTVEVPLVCTFCSKLFPNKVRLDVHTRTHTGDRPHKCSHCPKTFIRKYELKIHTRMHTKERPYQCGQCSKIFTQAGILARHTRMCPSQKKDPEKKDMDDKQGRGNLSKMKIN